MAKWEEVLDKQVDLLSWSMGPGKRFYDGYERSYTSKGVGKVSSLGKDLHANVITALESADPIYISPEIMMIAESAFPTFEEEPLLESDLVTPSGFIWLPKPIYLKDIHNKITANRGILWRTASFADENKIPLGKGLWFTLFSDSHDDDDYWKQTDIDFGRRPKGTFLNHIGHWLFNHPSNSPTSPQNTVRPIQVLFRLMLQTITVKSRIQGNRNLRRRLERQNIKPRDITVITLRRARHDTGPSEPKEVEWNHRWLVSGHWRNQWFPSLQQHRQIYINPYIKGPEDKPLEVHELRLFKVVR